MSNISRYALNLTHWGRVTDICVGNLTIIGSDNGLSPGRRQAITWTNVGVLLIGPLGTNFSEILIEIDTFSFKKIHLTMSSGKWRSFRPGLNVLTVPLVFVSCDCSCIGWPIDFWDLRGYEESMAVNDTACQHQNLIHPESPPFLIDLHCTIVEQLLSESLLCIYISLTHWIVCYLCEGR